MSDMVQAILLIVVTIGAYALPVSVAWAVGCLIFSVSAIAWVWMDGVSGIPRAVALVAMAVAVLVGMTSVRSRLEVALALVTSQTREDRSTGLPNRLAFIEVAAYEIPRCQRVGLPIAVLIVWFDPQPVGSVDVLGRLAALLETQKRDSDVLARIGENQFGILLPGCGLEDATRRAEHIRSLVERTGAEWPYPAIVTVGAVSVPDGVRSVTELLDAQDLMTISKTDVHRPLG